MQAILPRPVGGFDFINPYGLSSNAARYDLSNLSSLIYDGSNRLQLVSDLSGNSATNGLVLNGSVGNYASSPDSAAVSVTSDIDLRVYAALSDWTPATQMTLIGKMASGTERSYRLDVAATTGNLILNWSTDGTANTTATSTAAPSVSDFGSIWVRATLDVDNGAGGNTVTFYTSANGSMWTQLGSAVTGGSTTSIFDTTAAVEVGASFVGTVLPTAGIIYRAQIYNGINGTLAFDANFTAQAKLASSFTESSSNAATVTINTSGDTGARISGARDLYQGTQAKQPILYPVGQQQFTGDNSTFTGGAGNWVGWGAGTITASGGQGHFTSGATTDNGDFLAALCTPASTPLQSGITFTFSATLSNVTGGTVTLRNTSAGGQRYATGLTNGTFSVTVTELASNAQKNIGFAASAAGVTFDVDNITIVVAGVNQAYFDGSNDYMKAAPFSLSQPESIYLVCSQVAWTLNKAFQDGNATNSAIINQDTSTPNLRVYAGVSLGLLSFTVGVRGVLRQVLNGASSAFALNNTTGLSGNAGTTAAGGYTIGGSGDGSTVLGNITASEILIRSAADDSALQLKIAQYLMRKWGIT